MTETDSQTWNQWWPKMYTHHFDPVNYPGSHDSYKLAGEFLAGDDQVEEWGCATTFGRQFIPTPYRGVDGAPSRFVDQVADLSNYRSDTPNALMRHVLEHNWNWRIILDNFLLSFQDRGVVILFIPMGEHDLNRSFAHLVNQPPSPPGLQLDEASFLDMLNRPGLELVREETLENDTPPFGYERIFYLQKKEGAKALKSPRPRCKVKGCRRVGKFQVRSDYLVMGNRFEYQFNICKEHNEDMFDALYSLERLPDISWPSK